MRSARIPKALNPHSSKATPSSLKEVGTHATDIFEIAKEQKNAANKIKAHLKMHMVRKHVVMPSKIASYLTKNVGAFDNDKGETINWRKLSLFISREILEAKRAPKPYANFGKRFFGNEAPQRFAAFNRKNSFVMSEEIPMPACAWLSVDSSKRKAELEIIGECVGSGSAKTVYMSKILTIDLNSPVHPMEVHEAALVKQRSTVGANAFLSGVRFLESLPRNSNGLKIRAAGCFSHTQRNSNGSIEARDKLYLGDLLDCLDHLTLGSRLKVLGDAAKSLQWLHELGLVHGDVKPDNILVSKATRRGYLNDFDFGKRLGVNDSGTLGYIDTLGLLGYATPFLDIYGLAMSTAMCIFNTAVFEKNEDGTVVDLDDDTVKERINKNFSAMSPRRQKRLIKLKDNVISIISENKLTSQFLGENPLLKKDLQRGTSMEKQAAMLVLFSRFKGFDYFFSTLAKSY